MNNMRPFFPAKLMHSSNWRRERTDAPCASVHTLSFSFARKKRPKSSYCPRRSTVVSSSTNNARLQKTKKYRETAHTLCGRVVRFRNQRIPSNSTKTSSQDTRQVVYRTSKTNAFHAKKVASTYQAPGNTYTDHLSHTHTGYEQAPNPPTRKPEQAQNPPHTLVPSITQYKTFVRL